MTDHNYIYGHHPVTEAIQAGKPVEKVFFQQGERGESEKEIRHLTKEYGIPLQVVPREKLNKTVKGQHQARVEERRSAGVSRPSWSRRSNERRRRAGVLQLLQIEGAANSTTGDDFQIWKLAMDFANE